MPDWPAKTEHDGDVPRLNRPRPLQSMTAAATRLTSRRVTGLARGGRGWQEDAWQTYDQVGEQRFLANTLAGRMGQARIFVGLQSDDPDEPPASLAGIMDESYEGDPAPPGAETALEVFGALNDSPTAMGQRIVRLGVNLFVAGEALLVGIPNDLIAQARDGGATSPAAWNEADFISPVGGDNRAALEDLDLTDVEWRVMSVDELTLDKGRDELLIKVDGDDDHAVRCSPDDVVVLRIWRPHPRHHWDADSPTRSNLPVLRELMGLTMHISAQVDSRLAGAGVFLVPSSADDAVRSQAASQGLDVSDDPFSDALMEAMLTPIQDRSNAAALVPLVLTVPDDTTELFRHISFSTSLDSEARELREEAIRRFSLGADAPPELLTGAAGMNHWGAWLVREDVVTTHLEPPLTLICDALTTQYLWPVLEQQGLSPEQYQKFVVWYSVEHMIVRPNRAADALNLYDRGELTGRALRDETGFSETDAPKIETTDPAVDTALDMLSRAPSLAQNPGLPELVSQIREVLGGEGTPDVEGTDDESAPDGPPGSTEGDIPATSDDPAPDPEVAP